VGGFLEHLRLTAPAQLVYTIESTNTSLWIGDKVGGGVHGLDGVCVFVCWLHMVDLCLLLTVLLDVRLDTIYLLC
jgi:hypothetical protein